MHSGRPLTRSGRSFPSAGVLSGPWPPSAWAPGAWPAPPPPPSRRPTWLFPSGSVTGPPFRPSSGADTLVLAASSSGGTAETLTAAEKAVDAGPRWWRWGAGPTTRSAALAEDAGLAWCPTPMGPAASGPVVARPRAALGATTVPLLVALARAGLRPDGADAVQAAAANVARRRDALLAPGSPRRTGAPARPRTIPLVYGSAGVTSVAAQWWKTQVNLNAKAPAFAASVPELTHDELAGWGQSGDVTRQTMSLVLLRHAGEGPRNRRPVRRGPGGHRRGHGRHLRGAGPGR